MKITYAALAALALFAPAAAQADVCTQITGNYVSARSGKFNSTPNLIALSRITLRNGLGSGFQLTMTSESSPSAGNNLVRATSCKELTPTTARVSFDGATPGGGFSSAGSVIFTVSDGGARIWIKGETPGAELPGWLLRIPD